MKKFAAILLSAAMALSLAACNGSGGTDSGDPAGADSLSVSEEGGNVLIAYFSVPETDGVDTVAGASRVVVDGEVLGNNQYVAQLIGQQVGGTLFRIETAARSK